MWTIILECLKSMFEHMWTMLSWSSCILQKSIENLKKMLKLIKKCYENIFDHSWTCSCDSKTIYGIHTTIKKLQKLYKTTNYCKFKYIQSDK